MRAWLMLTGAIVTEVTGSLAMRGALDAPWLYAVTAVGYIVAFVFLGQVLRAGMPLGVAYGIWGAAGVALTAIGSLLVFGEPITWVMGIGIALVIAGVLLVELGTPKGEGESEGAATATASDEVIA